MLSPSYPYSVLDTALYLIDTDRGGPEQPNDLVLVANHIPQIYALDFRII